ncbi:hypothetical protein RFI_21454 [Reticulomyxa filosa]|uniref:Uncharacterized protein n=1 Tax=Reticulomyxa filosa TaxID=46433 RepID=X6MQ10_RETFI|nr:hypothetical protein RFI_21454 [Reticulomyxa filosa]|eukprot:ETO15909.1 hypothetical protein RFI_21454 [Reticulomyxa filosa]
MQEHAKEANWKEMLQRIKGRLKLTCKSSFLLVKKDKIVNEDKFMNLWNELINDEKIESNTTDKTNKKKRCLVILKEDKRMTWCPRNVKTLNFSDKENWEQHFADLKELVEKSSTKWKRFGKNLGKLCRDSDTYCLQLAMINTNNDKKESNEYNVQLGEKREECKIENATNNDCDDNEELFEKDNDVWPEMEYSQKAKFPEGASDDEGYVNSAKETSMEELTSAVVGKEKEVFDIQQMLKLVGKADEVATEIKDKHVILFLGGTGSGKSTLIHYLAGSKMEKQIVDGNNHIAPVEVKNKALRNVVTSARAVSETRHITAVPIDLKEMRVFTEEDSVVLCDTPVDVANGIGIIRALKCCKSIKPVVLVSYTALGNRMSCVRGLARTLGQIISSIDDHLSAVEYVFTKFPKKEKQTIPALVRETYFSIPKDETDKGYKSILADIARKTKKYVFAPHLLEDPPLDLLQELTDIRSFIRHPEEQTMLSTYKWRNTRLVFCQHSKIATFKFVQTKLDELVALNAVLENKLIEENYNECIKILTKEWNAKNEEAKIIFNKCLASSHTLSNEDCVAYKQTISEFTTAEILRTHLPEAIGANSLNQNLDNQVLNLIRDIESHVDNEIAVNVNLNKIMQVKTCFPEFNDPYKQVCQKLSCRLTDRAKQATESIQKSKFEDLRKDLEAFKKDLILQGHLISIFDIEKEMKNLENLLIANLKQVASKGLEVFKKSMKRDCTAKKDDEEIEQPAIQIEKLAGNDMQILHKTLALLESAAYVFQQPLGSVSLNKPTQEIYSSFLDEVVAYIEKVGEKISSLFEKQRYRAFEEIKGFVLVMDELRNMKSVEQRTNRSYYQIIEKIFSFVREVHKDVSMMLPLLFKQEESVDYSRLFECVLCVNRSEWIDERQEGGSSNLMNTVRDQLITHLCELEQSSQNLELDLDHPDHLEQGYKIVTHLSKLRRLEHILPEMTPLRQRAHMQLEQKIHMTLSMIQRDFALVECENPLSQKQMQECLTQLKSYAQRIRNANLYLQENNFESAQNLTYRIESIQQQLNKSQDKGNDVSHTYNDANKNQSWFPFFRASGHTSSTQKDSERKDTGTFHTEEEIDKLKEGLQKSLQIKKEYEKMLSREKEPVIKLLKNHGFLEDEIHRLMNDEDELEEKIQEYEQKINNANAENCTSKCRFERLNVSRAEKVLHYIKQCKAICYCLTESTSNPSATNVETMVVAKKKGEEEEEEEEKDTKQITKTTTTTAMDLSQMLATTTHSVESFLQSYSEFMESQLKIFDIIDSETSSKEDKIQAREKVKNIADLLNEVTMLQNNHTLLAAYLPRNLLKQLNNRLQQLWMSMSSEMAKLARQTDFQSLKTKVLVAKSLSVLDEFITNDNYNFRILFDKYQDRLYNDVIDTKKLLEAIEGHRYTEVASEMSKLKQRAVDNPQVEKVLEDMQSLLSCLLKALMKSTFLEVLVLGENEVNLDSVIKLEEHLQWIEEAKHFVFTYVDQMTQDYISKKERATKSAIGKWVQKILGTIDAAINSCNFWEAEERIKLVRRIRRILGDYYEQYHSSNKHKKVQEEQEQKQEQKQKQGKKR